MHVNRVQDEFTDCYTYPLSRLVLVLLSIHFLLSFKSGPSYVCVVVQSPLKYYGHRSCVTLGRLVGRV